MNRNNANPRQGRRARAGPPVEPPGVPPAALPATPTRPPLPSVLFWRHPDRTVGQMVVLDVASDVPPPRFQSFIAVPNIQVLPKPFLESCVYFDASGKVRGSYYATELHPMLRPVLQLHHHLGQQALDAIQRSYTRATLLDGISSTPHGVLAALRELYEHDTYEYLIHKYPNPDPALCHVVDVGASPDRHIRRGRDVHMMIPNVIVGDSSRFTRAQDFVNAGDLSPARLCQHTLGLCNCPSVTTRPFLLVHSLYYIGPQELLSALVRHRSPVAIAIHHKFELAGNLFDEAVYHICPEDPTSVVMHVTGNAALYRHSRLAWMESGYYTGHVEGRLTTLVWESVAIGPKEAQLYRTKFTISVSPPEAGHPVCAINGLEDLLTARPGTRGVVGHKDPQFNGLMAAMVDPPGLLSGLTRWLALKMNLCEPDQVDLMFETNCIVLCQRSSPRPVIVSKLCAEHIASKMQGSTFSQATIDAAVAHARLFYGVKTNVPIVLGAEMMLPTVRLGILLAVQRTKTHHSALSLLGPQIHEINRTAARLFAGGVQPRLWQSLVAGAIGGMVLCLLFIRALRGHRLPTFGLAAVAQAHNNRPKPRWPLMALIAVALSYYQVTKGSSKTHKPRQLKPDLAICVSELPLPPIGKGPSGSPLHSIRVDARSPCKPQFGAVPVVRCSYRRPVVVASCHHNIHAGLRIRMMSRDRPAVPIGFDTLVGKPHFDQLRNTKQLRPVPIDEWLCRFEPARREKLKAAYGEYQLRGPDPSRYLDRDIFIKRETYIKEGLTQDGTPIMNPLKPRIISGPDLEYLVRTGPITLAASNRLKKYWNGVHTNIIYASGRTPDALGALFHQIVAELGPETKLFMVEADAENFDSSKRLKHYEFESKVYKKMGMSKEARRLILLQAGRKKIRWTDRSPLGANQVHAELSECQNSGDAWTSVGNSITSAELCHLMVGPSFASGYLFVLGDDTLFITTIRAASGLPAIQTMQDRASQAGFTMEIQTHEGNRGTFCSGVFVPCKRLMRQEDGRVIRDATYVWAVLPGRLFSKIGWCTNNYEHLPDPDQAYFDWLQGVAMGLRKDTAFVPVVRSFIARLLQLLQRPNVKPVHHDFRRHTKGDYEVCSKTFAWFCDRYGCSPLDIIDAERFFSSWELHQPYDHPLIHKIIDRDAPLSAKVSPCTFQSEASTMGSILLPIKPLFRRLWHWVPQCFATMASSPMATLGAMHSSMARSSAPPLRSLWCGLLVSTLPIFEWSPRAPYSLWAHSFLDLVVLVPLVEEILKAVLSKFVGPYSGLAFGLFELAWNYCLSRPTSVGTFVLDRVLPLCLHSLLPFVCKTFATRLCAHALWNYYVWWAMFMPRVSASMRKITSVHLFGPNWHTIPEEYWDSWARYQPLTTAFSWGFKAIIHALRCTEICDHWILNPSGASIT